jgi:hypothetical protein
MYRVTSGSDQILVSTGTLERRSHVSQEQSFRLKEYQMQLHKPVLGRLNAPRVCRPKTATIKAEPCAKNRALWVDTTHLLGGLPGLLGL